MTVVGECNATYKAITWERATHKRCSERQVAQCRAELGRADATVRAQREELQQAQEMRRRQIEAAVAQARQQLVSTNADHARIMGVNVNANPALARKRDDKVREILAKRAKIESVIEQLLEKLPPGERGA